MKLTNTSIRIKPSDLKQIIINNTNNDPNSNENRISYVFNDTISKPDPSDDFTIYGKNDINVTNLGFLMSHKSHYAQKNIIPNIKNISLSKCIPYGEGYIGVVENINNFPIPKEIILTPEEILLFKQRMKK